MSDEFEFLKGGSPYGNNNIPGYEIPFMEIPEGFVSMQIGEDPNTILVDGVDYETAIAELPEPLGKVPVILFKFHNSQGMKVAPIALMMSADYLQAFKEGFNQAINSAIRKAKKHGV